MTFPLDPIHPSEGRDDDKYQVNKIESDKLYDPSKNSIPQYTHIPHLDIAYLHLLKTATKKTSTTNENPSKKLTPDLLTALHELSDQLTSLSSAYANPNQQFFETMSKTWKTIIHHHIFNIDHHPLNELIQQINNYPTPQYSLGFYLSQNPNDTWFPIPLQNIFTSLCKNHQKNPSYSILTQWFKLIDNSLHF